VFSLFFGEKYQKPGKSFLSKYTTIVTSQQPHPNGNPMITDMFSDNMKHFLKIIGS